MTHHVLAHARLTDVDAQLEKFAVHSRCATERIGQAQLPNPLADLFRAHWPTGLTVPDLPRPEQTEALPVPSDYGLRFDDDQRRSPVGPDLAQPGGEESIRKRQSRPLYRALQDAELVPKCQVSRWSAARDRKVAERAAANTRNALPAERRVWRQRRKPQVLI
jgi:hypothetical protein